MDDGHVYFFTRVMKTGSTSFVHYMHQTLGGRRLYPRKEDKKPESAFLLSMLRDAHHTDGDELVGYAGHFPAFAADLVGATRTITFLRDPVERTISYLKQAKALNEQLLGRTLEEIYEDPFWFQLFIDNHQTKIFSLREEDEPDSYMQVIRIDQARLDAAKERLARIDIVGLQEEYDAGIEAVEQRWGWPPRKREWFLRSSPGEEIAQEFRDRIAEDNAWDVELYEWAAQHVAVRGPRRPPAEREPEPVEDDRWSRGIAAMARTWRPPVRPRAVAPDLYLDLVERSLLGLLAAEAAGPRRVRNLPLSTLTMIGAARMANIRSCVEQVLAEGVPGDLIETGVWRGGATIYMRAILAARGIADRRVWAADSFQGFPEPDTDRFPLDRPLKREKFEHLVVPLDEVRASFERYELLDDQVVFLEGWFQDTLPQLGDELFAVVRLDGDSYESTAVCLEHLYPRLSEGGYLIVDDYGALPMCRAAVDDYRLEQGIEETVEWIDETGVYWQKRS